MIEQSCILLRWLYINSMNSRVKIEFFLLIVEDEDDGEVVEPEIPSKIRRVTKLDGRVIYEF